MAKLYFRYGAMNCGKTALLLQAVHNYEARGMKVLVLKPIIDSKGGKTIVSRIGLKREVDHLIKNTEDIEIISKQIVEENVFIFRAYNLSDINVVWKSVDDELYVYGGDELYATIDVERKGLLVKLSFYWNQEKLNQNMGG